MIIESIVKPVVYQYLSVLIMGLALFACDGSANPDDFGPLSELSENLENALLKKLEAAQHGARIQTFTSDGCSGGLSSGWESMAAHFPPFKQHFGELPPWQQCCVAHDRLYWVGVIKDGYKERKQADAELRHCVIAKGEELAPELANKFHMSEQEVQRAFTLAGRLMYHAVRFGGRPCSGLPWRWGYGWPQCNPLGKP